MGTGPMFTQWLARLEDIFDNCPVPKGLFPAVSRFRAPTIFDLSPKERLWGRSNVYSVAGTFGGLGGALRKLR
jgi:hypothetical protein